MIHPQSQFSSAALEAGRAGLGPAGYVCAVIGVLSGAFGALTRSPHKIDRGRTGQNLRGFAKRLEIVRGVNPDLDICGGHYLRNIVRKASGTGIELAKE
jgi:hypothetical protein